MGQRARARLRSGLRLAAPRTSEASRPAQYDKRSANSTREITSSRLLWIRLPWSVLWRPELREGVDDQPRARGQVASHPDSQPNYPPRLESRIKTRRVHFLFWVCMSVCGLGCFTKFIFTKFCQIAFCLVPIGIVSICTKNGVNCCTFRGGTLFHNVDVFFYFQE